MKLLCAALILFLPAYCAFAQDTVQQKNNLHITGYAEIYDGLDFNHPQDHNRPSFVYSHNRSNEVNLNLGFIKAGYDNGLLRANLALMAGTYANANLSAEPGVFKNLFEGNAGIKLTKTANIWLDAGIFASHIGYESAVSKDCWTLTRNIASDNTPYFESGAKLTYTSAGGGLVLTALYLNGWQRIYRQDGNNKPAGGLEIFYKPADNISLNYSNYLGTQGADSVSVRRFYNNFYAVIQLSAGFGITAGFDYGIQQKAKNSSVYNQVISPVGVVRYQFAQKWAAAARAEYYQDAGGIFIATQIQNGFKTSAYSLNINYAPVKNAVLRLEGKTYSSADAVFIRYNRPVRSDAVLTASFAVSF